MENSFSYAKGHNVTQYLTITGEYSMPQQVTSSWPLSDRYWHLLCSGILRGLEW